MKVCNYFAIFDGHGGSDVANHLKDKLHSHLLTNYDHKDFQANLIRSTVEFDEEIQKKAGKELFSDTSGSSALVLLNFGRILIKRSKISISERRGLSSICLHLKTQRFDLLF